MKKKTDSFLNAELDDEQDLLYKKQMLEEDSAEGDMLRVFELYKKNISLPTQSASLVSSIKIQRPQYIYLVAASIALLITASLTFYLVDFKTTPTVSQEWEMMSVFEKLNYVNTISYAEIDQKDLWAFYQKEEQINVRISLLRVLNSSMFSEDEFLKIIEKEESPLLRHSLLAMKE